MPDNPWSAAVAAAQAQAIAAANARSTAGGMAAAVAPKTTSLDKCPAHPGVKWTGDRPCFVCDPDAWADAPGGYVETSLITTAELMAELLDTPTPSE